LGARSAVAPADLPAQEVHDLKEAVAEIGDFLRYIAVKTSDKKADSLGKSLKIIRWSVENNSRRGKGSDSAFACRSWSAWQF